MPFPFTRAWCFQRGGGGIRTRIHSVRIGNRNPPARGTGAGAAASERPPALRPEEDVPRVCCRYRRSALPLSYAPNLRPGGPITARLAEKDVLSINAPTCERTVEGSLGGSVGPSAGAESVAPKRPTVRSAHGNIELLRFGQATKKRAVGRPARVRGIVLSLRRHGPEARYTCAGARRQKRRSARAEIHARRLCCGSIRAQPDLSYLVEEAFLTSACHILIVLRSGAWGRLTGRLRKKAGRCGPLPKQFHRYSYYMLRHGPRVVATNLWLAFPIPCRDILVRSNE